MLHPIQQRKFIQPPRATGGRIDYSLASFPDDDGPRAVDRNRQPGLPVKLHAGAGGEFVVIDDRQQRRFRGIPCPTPTAIIIPPWRRIQLHVEYLRVTIATGLDIHWQWTCRMRPVGHPIRDQHVMTLAILEQAGQVQDTGHLLGTQTLHEAAMIKGAPRKKAHEAIVPMPAYADAQGVTGGETQQALILKQVPGHGGIQPVVESASSHMPV